MYLSAGRKFVIIFSVLVLFLAAAIFIVTYPGGEQPVDPGSSQTITDLAGRGVEVPDEIERIICSGSGCLRLVTYLESKEKVVGVDSIEKEGSPVDARPYAVANPGYSELPLFGEFRGHDQPELIVSLDPAPQLIFKICTGGPGEADRLESKTGIPVLCIDYGKLPHEAEDIYETLKFMGEVLGKENRARAVVDYFKTLKADLASRRADTTDNPSAYLGGLAHRGPHGLRSTNPTYPPFEYLPVENVARKLSSNEKTQTHATVDREKILDWDPGYIFIDAASLRLSGRQNSLFQLLNHPAYRDLSAPGSEDLFVLFPENSYNQNFGTVFANAYFIGKQLFPAQFEDVEPLRRAEEISKFLNGGPAYREIKKSFDNRPFERVEGLQ